MTDYNMLFEKIVLAAWKGTWRREDPFQLGDADTLGSVDDDLSGQNGHDAKFALSTAIRKVAAENRNNDVIYESLLKLDKDIWAAKKFNDICNVMKGTKPIFNQLGMGLIG